MERSLVAVAPRMTVMTKMSAYASTSTIADRGKRTWVGGAKARAGRSRRFLHRRGETDIDNREPTQRVPRGRWNLARALLVFP